MTAEFLDLEWHIFECTKYKLTWYFKGIEVCQDFDLRQEGKFNPKKCERELYSHLKIGSIRTNKRTLKIKDIKICQLWQLVSFLYKLYHQFKKTERFCQFWHRKMTLKVRIVLFWPSILKQPKGQKYFYGCS